MKRGIVICSVTLPLYAQQQKLFTQIGSLPFRTVDQAIAYSIQHDIPFLPELVMQGEAMLDYIKDPGHLICLAKFKEHQFETVKIQCIGPATLIAAGYEENDALLRIYTHIERIVDGLQARETVLFLDEPSLGYVGYDYERLWEVIFSGFQVIRGVHICGNMQWDRLFRADIDIISFDAHRYDITKYYRDRQGKHIAWGVHSLEDIKDFQIGDLITPPCGLGGKSVTAIDADAKLTQLRQISEEVKRVSIRASLKLN